MPLPTNKSRPSLPYEPEQSLPNNQRFDLLGKKPPTAQMLDAEFNAVTDDINLLAHAINEVEAGNIPGWSREPVVCLGQYGSIGSQCGGGSQFVFPKCDDT